MRILYCRLKEILGNIIMGFQRFVPDLLIILLHHREYRGERGWRQKGRYVTSKLQKIVSVIVVESLAVPPHIYVLPVASILPK